MPATGGVINAFTVDTEEWFHICGLPELGPDTWDELPSRIQLTTRLLLEDLDACAIRATFLIVGWVAERYPGLVHEILSAGHEVGSHSYLHRRVYEMTPAAFEADLRRSIDALAEAGAPAVTCFRAPEWSLNHRAPWGFEILAASGIRIDSSMAPIAVVGQRSYSRRPHVMATGAGGVIELPPLVADRLGQVVPAGWGWGLRMSAPARTVRLTERVNAAGVPAVFTVHPWEIDPDPPQVRLPAGLRFAHYFRLAGFRQRLRRVMEQIPFGTLSDAALAARPGQ